MHIRAIQGVSGWKRQAMAFFTGALTALALPLVNFFPVCFVTFTVFTWLLDGIDSACLPKRRKHYALATLTGWNFGFGYFTAGLWWLGSAMLIDITAYGWAIPFAVLGLPAFLACFYAFAAFAAFVMWQPGYGRILALGFAFGLSEWLRGWMFTGFPWNAIGYTAMPFPLLMQPAAVVGLDGMNALAVLVYATPALVSAEKGRKTGFAIAALLIAADMGFGFYRLASEAPPGATGGRTIRVRLIQPSILQTEKIDQATWQTNLERQLQLTTAAPAEGGPRPRLIIWPETALPFVLEYAPSVLMRIGDALKPDQLVLAGAIRMEETDSGLRRYFNSLQVINPEGRIIASADKVHLVPFGEYLPFNSLFKQLGLTAIAQAAGGYSAGAKHTSIAIPDGPVILPLICYEAIFPAELAYEGPRADVIVNITNDAWFGDTPGPWQHFAQARIRAVEQATPLIRVANNGISAVIDPYGRIITMIKHDEISFTDIDLYEKIVSKWNMRIGNIPAFHVFTVLFLFSMVVRIFRRC